MSRFRFQGIQFEFKRNEKNVNYPAKFKTRPRLMRDVGNYCLFIFFFLLLSLLLLVYSLFVVLGVDVRLPDPEFVFCWFESGR